MSSKIIKLTPPRRKRSSLEHPDANTSVTPRVTRKDPDMSGKWKQYFRRGKGSKVETELVEFYLPLVKAVVCRLAMTLPSHVHSEDLYSAGLVGLLNAVRRYDPSCGTSFETYSRVRIRGAVFDELRRLDWVPRSVHDKARKVETVMRDLEQKKGKAPSDLEMAKAMNLSLNDYQELSEQIKPATFVCLDSSRNGETEEGASQYESVADERQTDPGEDAIKHELAELVVGRLDHLPEPQRKVLSLYYFQDLRLREIAEKFGVTESRICQIHSQAILSLRSFVRRQEALAA